MHLGLRLLSLLKHRAGHGLPPHSDADIHRVRRIGKRRVKAFFYRFIAVIQKVASVASCHRAVRKVAGKSMHAKCDVLIKLLAPHCKAHIKIIFVVLNFNIVPCDLLHSGCESYVSFIIVVYAQNRHLRV